LRFERALALSCAALLSLPAVSQAADRYVMPPPGYSPEMSSDEAGIWMQVDKAEANLKTSPQLVRDEKLNAYVGGLVCKLAAEYCPSIRVYILDVPEFNAYAMPNGAVVVYTGLLLQAENEAQLAFVLGHEITHYQHRHSLEHLRMAVNTSGFLAVFGIAAAGAGVGILGSVASLAGVGAIYSNSRDEERDADEHGFMIGTRSGYAPGQAPAIWRFVAEEEKAAPDHSRGMFLADHPESAERMNTLQKAADAASPTRSDWIVNEDGFHAVTEPFAAKWVAAELAKGRIEQSVVLFRRLAANLPSRGIYQYGLGEAYRRRNQANDVTAAASAYRGALACPDAPVESWRGLGLLAMKSGDNAGAKDAFTQYRAKSPEADDKAMIDFYLTQL
jgi:beta-barrel assembly-enhancing protease